MQSALELGQLKHSRSTMARAAQVKFDAWLKEHGKVVYGDIGGESARGLYWRTNKSNTDNRKAILVCAEPIEKCTHPREKVTWSFESKEYRCTCGVSMIPSAYEPVKPHP